MRWVNFKRRGEIVHQSIMHDVICNLRIHLERYQAWYLSRGASILGGDFEETPYGALQEQSESEGGSEQSESEDEVIYDNVIDEVTDDEFEI